MANNKTNNKTETETEKNLKKQLEQLRNEVTSITSTLSDFSSNKMNEAKNKAEQFYSSAKENGEELLLQAKSKYNNLEKTLNQQVRDNPGKAILIATGIGFILSHLLRR
ncbi:Hypotethical [Bartonella clarridgeiae 73]|uniref:Hypotethical n=1 Tax=Bartonella clarridgeiae (strain CCUG 45776 / CIP 104772 / 73) TaxID=696125 RepID=E6YJ47_BARC7|nr:DUF883 family protein [Bartonella clarridgeiae]CBI76885.1 Hypotethical [Bartonella clarridgeiae 73]